jgi:hypothetical protein
MVTCVGPRLFPFSFGFGMTADEAEALIASKPLVQELAADPEVMALTESAERPAGNVDRINIRPNGTSASYLVRRLKRDRLDITDALASGE